jgi:hypothetical protein
MRGTTKQEISNALSSTIAVVGAIPVASRVDGGVARQQQLHDVNVTITVGRVQVTIMDGQV